MRRRDRVVRLSGDVYRIDPTPAIDWRVLSCWVLGLTFSGCCWFWFLRYVAAPLWFGR